MNKSSLLGKLPPFRNNTKLIEKNQSVHDIVDEVLNAHQVFASDYDKIAGDFDAGSIKDICKNLFSWCKSNIRYRVEPEAKQTTKSPAAIIALGDTIGGDCKHYAGFIAGILDGIKRRGKNVDWNYRFASYNMFNKEPQHVFVVVNDQGKEYWIDPVLGKFDERLYPYHTPLDKKPLMSLNRLSGLARVSGLSDIVPVNVANLDEVDSAMDKELLSAIQILLNYQVLDTRGRISESRLAWLQNNLPANEFAYVAGSMDKIKAAAIGGFFDSIWTGIKAVTLSLPRTAYLELVLLNFNGMATKMFNIIYDANGQFRTDEAGQLRTKWESLGGKWDNLLANVVLGNKIKMILGNVAPYVAARKRIGIVEAAAWAATAAVIIAAMTPIVTSLISKIAAKGSTNPGINPLTGLPGGVNPPPKPGGTSIIDWAKENPIIVAGIVGGGYFLYTQYSKPKRRNNVRKSNSR